MGADAMNTPTGFEDGVPDIIRLPLVQDEFVGKIGFAYIRI